MPILLSRFPAFYRVLRIERPAPWRQAWALLTQAWALMVSQRVPRSEWRQRMRTCPKCPIFDRSLKRCRPYNDHPWGCGCFTPFLAMIKFPNPKGCWADAHLPEEHIGWNTSTKPSNMPKPSNQPMTKEEFRTE